MSMIGCLRRVGEDELRAVLDDPESIFDLLDSEEGEIDLDKAWHGIHFLLTGTGWEGEGPLAFLVKGGQEVGEEDVGYGPARAFFPDAVAAIAAAIAPLTNDELTARYDTKRMTSLEIYPGIWDREDERASNLEYLLDYFDTLRDFVKAAAAEHQGLLVYIQ